MELESYFDFVEEDVIRIIVKSENKFTLVASPL